MDAISFFLVEHHSCKHCHVEHVPGNCRIEGADLTGFLNLRNPIIDAASENDDDGDDTDDTCIRCRLEGVLCEPTEAGSEFQCATCFSLEQDCYAACGPAKREIKSYSNARDKIPVHGKAAHDAYVESLRQNIIVFHEQHCRQCFARNKAHVDVDMPEASDTRRATRSQTAKKNPRSRAASEDTEDSPLSSPPSDVTAKSPTPTPAPAPTPTVQKKGKKRAAPAANTPAQPSKRAKKAKDQTAPLPSGRPRRSTTQK